MNNYKDFLLWSIPESECRMQDDGLHFINPKLMSGCIEIKIKKDNANVSTDLVTIHTNKNNATIKDIGKPVTLEMGCVERNPVAIDTWNCPLHLHQYLSDCLGQNRGILDMWIKSGNNDTIRIPRQLMPIKNLLQRIGEFEINSNPDFLKWNMWLLIDIKNIRPGMTQRNTGYHYDGLNISGRYRNQPLVSIYVWYNKLGTLFYSGKTQIDKNIDVSKYNMSSFAQKQIKLESDIICLPDHSIIRSDGASVHSSQHSTHEIADRIFVRVCFTAPYMLFDRLGNTINPCQSYPDNFIWKSMTEPSVKLKNCTKFSYPEEFKNMWDAACIGHPSFAIAFTGYKSSQYQLILKLKKSKTIQFLKKIIALYDYEIDWYDKKNLSVMKDISEWRKYILIYKFFM